MTWHAKNVCIFAIGVNIGGQNTRGAGGLQNHGASAITKQNASRAIFEIEYAAENFGADDQGSLGRACFDHGISHSHGINKATANSLHIKYRTTHNAKLVL